MLNLAAVFDLHLHTAPDLAPRCLDDLEAAAQAAARGMKGILLKSHYTQTADRARIAEKVVPGVKIYGSLVLNQSVGGLNPSAVEAALRLGAKEIFMPTLSADNHRRAKESERGISILNPGSQAALGEILALVKEHGAILGTGHLSKKEIASLVGRALDQGIRKILITHPEHPLIDLSVAEQLSLKREGVYFERCFASTLPRLGDIPLERIARQIREVGAYTTILTTDLGIAGYPSPVEGMERFIAALEALGLRKEEIDIMTRSNPGLLVE